MALDVIIAVCVFAAVVAVLTVPFLGTQEPERHAEMLQE